MSVEGLSANHDFVLENTLHGWRTAVRDDGDEVTIFQQHPGTLTGEYWNVVAVREGELERLYESLTSDTSDLPDKLRGGAWKTDASVRPSDEYVSLVQSSAGAGGRNGDSVRVNVSLVEAILDRID